MKLRLSPSPSVSSFWAPLAIALCLPTGCASIPRNIQEPEVALESVDIQKATLTDATVLLKLNVRNPNSFSLKLDNIRYGLSLGDQPFASGQLAEGATIGANGESQVSVPVRMKYWDIFGRFSELLKKSSTSYKISGSVRSGGRDFPFEHKGDVPLPHSG